jgi:hypothetical protein
VLLQNKNKNIHRKNKKTEVANGLPWGGYPIQEETK